MEEIKITNDIKYIGVNDKDIDLFDCAKWSIIQFIFNKR